MALDRRRSRRIEADRPTTDDWSVRESMVFEIPSGRGPGGRFGPRSRSVSLASRDGRRSELCAVLDAGASRIRFENSVDALPAIPFGRVGYPSTLGPIDVPVKRRSVTESQSSLNRSLVAAIGRTLQTPASRLVRGSWPDAPERGRPSARHIAVGAGPTDLSSHPGGSACPSVRG